VKSKKWIAYGVTGVVGLGLIAGGATAAAVAMDLRDAEGTTLPGGELTGKGKAALEVSEPVRIQVTDDSAAILTAPTAVTPATPLTPVTPVTVVTPQTPPSPVTPATPVSPVTPASPASAVSAPST
jgi:hypothetical protein